METVMEWIMRYLNQPVFHLLLVTAGILVVATAVRLFIRKVLLRLVKRTRTEIDDLIVQQLSGPSFYVVLFLGLRMMIERFYPESIIIKGLVSTTIIIIIARLIVRVLDSVIQHWMVHWAAKTKSKLDDELLPLAGKALKVTVYLLAVMFIFETWNLKIGPLLATMGIGGIALALALKDSLSNIFGGIQLILDRSFKVGDKIRLETGELGLILDIGLRSTKLKTYDNELIYIPNSQLANSRIKNYSHPDVSIRINVPFGVVYGTDIKETQDIVLDAIKRIENAVDEPAPAVLFLAMADFSLNFVARVWVSDYNVAFMTEREMTQAVYEALNRAGIGIPFPTRTIYTIPG
jgi:MscS family membrane protein